MTAVRAVAPREVVSLLEDAITRIAQHACRQGESGDRSWPDLSTLPAPGSWRCVGETYAPQLAALLLAPLLRPAPAPARGKRTVVAYVVRAGTVLGAGRYVTQDGTDMRTWCASRDDAERWADASECAHVALVCGGRVVAIVRREPRDWAKLVEEHAALTARVASLADVEAARGDPGCGTHAQAVADALIDAAKWVMLEASLFDEGKRLGAELVKRAVKVAGADYVALRLP